MFCHKKSFFPLVIVLLTCALGIFMFSVFSHQSNNSSAVTFKISKSSYESSVKFITDDFTEKFGSTLDYVVKLTLVEKALTDLLQLRVPSEDKDIHLELVIGLNQLKEELNAKQTTSPDSLLKFNKARSKIESWK